MLMVSDALNDFMMRHAGGQCLLGLEVATGRKPANACLNADGFDDRCGSTALRRQATLEVARGRNGVARHASNNS